MIRFVSYMIIRLFTSLAVSLTILCAINAQAQSPTLGQTLGFEDAQHKTWFLHDFKGKPVIINLWATWCVPCIQEMPSLAELQQEYAGKGLVVLALSEDDSIVTAINFYKDKKITSLTPYFDKDHAIWKAVHARGIPTTLLINSDGKTVEEIEGGIDWQSPKLRTMLSEIVK